MNRHPPTYDIAIAKSEGRAIRMSEDGLGNYRINRVKVAKEVVDEWLELTRFPHRKKQSTFKVVWLMFKEREAMALFNMTFE